MRINITNLYILLLACVWLVSPSLAHSYQQGSYPLFSHSQLLSSGGTVSNSANKVKSAIEANQTLNLVYDNPFRSAKRYLFPDKYFGNSYYTDKLMTVQFVESFQKVIAEFACAEYRFRNRSPQQTGCDGYVSDTRYVEKMPFVAGQFISNRIEVNRDNKQNRVSFYSYLSSTSEVPLTSTFGAIHQLGTFFGRMASNKSLVLSINVEAFLLGNDGLRTSPINDKPVTYFIVIPPSVEIANQPSQTQAAKYAVNNAKLILVR